jgi:predicted flap endonuclease-1-like 5' DNA nuclease
MINMQGHVMMTEDRSLRMALSSALLLAALLLATNVAVLRAPLLDLGLPVLLAVLGLAAWFVRLPSRSEALEAQEMQPVGVPDVLVVRAAPALTAAPVEAPAVEVPAPEPVAEVAAPAVEVPAPEPVAEVAAPAVEVPAPEPVAEVAAPADTQEHVETVEVPPPTLLADEETVQIPAAADDGDDLTLINGIGPKIAAALRGMGITTFAQLGDANETTLREALEAVGAKRLGDPAFWIAQAPYAARGDWDGMQRAIDDYKAKNSG